MGRRQQARPEGGDRFFTSELHQYPYPHYDRVRAETPVFRDPYSGEVVLTRYRDVVAALKDARLSSRRVAEAGLPGSGGPMGWLLRPVSGVLGRQMLFSDPPDHTRLRGLANKAFTPRVVQTMRGRVQEMAGQLLDRVQHRSSFDVIGDYAVWLPILVIAEMLGVPAQDRRRFKTWSDDLALFIGGTTLPMPLVMARAARGVSGFRRYFRALIRKRRKAAPVDDLLGALIAAEEQGDTLTEEELLANAMLILAAGHETTTNLIGNGMYALLQHRDQMERLRNEPCCIESAVEEFLRYDSPVQWTGRVATEDLEIAGETIRAGELLAIGIGAANRDPAQFVEPDRLDICRSPNPHVAFSHGIHFCLGAALARLEGQIAIAALLSRYPQMSVAKQPLHWHPNYTLRGLKTLALRV